MKLVKGSKAAKNYMAKIRAKKTISGAKKPIVNILSNGKKLASVKCLNDADAKKVIDKAKKDGYQTKRINGLDKVVRNGNKTSVQYTRAVAPKKAVPKKAVQGKLFGIGDLFDYSVIKDIDDLKKQYFKLAKKYHPDSGGTTSQFQQLGAEYDKAFKKLLSGSSLSDNEKNIEIDIDEIIRKIIDEIISLETISIELIGKWIWVGSTEPSGQFLTPIYHALTKAGLKYIKKAGRPYMVYKGAQTSSRGRMSIDDIKSKYGVHKFEAVKNKKITGVRISNRAKITTLFKKLTLLLNKRSV